MSFILSVKGMQRERDMQQRFCNGNFVTVCLFIYTGILVHITGSTYPQVDIYTRLFVMWHSHNCVNVTLLETRNSGDYYDVKSLVHPVFLNSSSWSLSGIHLNHTSVLQRDKKGEGITRLGEANRVWDNCELDGVSHWYILKRAVSDDSHVIIVIDSWSRCVLHWNALPLD